jgi:ABC-2 type transport system permease protein
MTVFYLGEPDLGPIVTGYLGSFLMAGAYLAVGCFFSALTKNQVISFILAVVACAVLFSIGLPTTVDYLSNALPESLLVAVENLSFQTHFESMQKGIVAFKDMSYFILMIVGWVWACCIILEERKAA